MVYHLRDGTCPYVLSALMDTSGSYLFVISITSRLLLGQVMLSGTQDYCIVHSLPISI